MSDADSHPVRILWPDGRSPSIIDTERLVAKANPVPQIRTDLISEAPAEVSAGGRYEELPEPVRSACRRHRSELTSRLPCDRGHHRGMTRETISLVAELRNEWMADPGRAEPVHCTLDWARARLTGSPGR
jgi:hypothetical protein